MQPNAHFQAALGWFDLGNYAEAFNELDCLPPSYRASVEAMELRCWVYRKLEKWRELEVLSEGCYTSSKQDIVFLNHLSWSLLKQGKGEAAQQFLERHHASHTTRDAEIWLD